MGGPPASIKIDDVFITNEGYAVKVLQYKNSNDITVTFEDGTIIKTYLTSLITGGVKNKNHRSRYGVGYVGYGKHKTKEKGKETPAYSRWVGILERCYNTTPSRVKTSYIGCSVDEDWHSFQSFAEWFYSNYIDGWQIDKDLLGGCIYSPNNCLFLPNKINNAIQVGRRGYSLNAKSGRFLASISKGNVSIKVGTFHTKEEAIECYLKHKKIVLLELIEEYKDILSLRTKSLLLDYKFKIKED